MTSGSMSKKHAVHTHRLQRRAKSKTWLYINIAIALVANMILVYIVLKSTRFFEKLLGPTGLHILRKIFGIILLAIAIKLFISNTGIELGNVK